MKETLTDKQQQILQYGINLHPVVPIRKEPQEQSEMISQLLFGESYLVTEILERWLKITTGFDHCTGWIDRKLLREISSEEYRCFTSIPVPVLASGLAEIDLPDSTKMVIPAGSSLPGYSSGGKVIIDDMILPVRSMSGDDILLTGRMTETARKFLNAPYLWGGRSSFGLDCSGFIQTVFKIHGISLPRDTSRQAESGIDPGTLEETMPGDLVFFASDKEIINHVGMITAPGEIIHCSGWVRLDVLDNTGIYNSETRMHTHRLKLLRRIGESSK
jgi:gamma-D-glutamyl-L-lysine dipeptidyl-peptidase